jgi:hypothetical protein
MGEHRSAVEQVSAIAFYGELVIKIATSRLYWRIKWSNLNSVRRGWSGEAWLLQDVEQSS